MIGRLIALGFCAATLSLAEKPTLEHLYPTATARGATNALTLTGKFDPWPPKIWSSTPGLEFTFPTNKGTVHLTVSADVPAGPSLVRLYNDDGASEVAIFVVTKSPQIPDTEPNNHFSKPQHCTNLPATINGRLDKNNDVDSFQFALKAGQWLDARVDSHTLMSKLDAVLRLTTTNGYQLAWNHDFSSFDPRLVWQAARDETVVLQVFGFAYPAGSEIVLSGGNGGVYQLHISTNDKPPADLNIPLNEDAAVTGCAFEIYGAICPAGDEDKFPIDLKKDDTIELRVEATDFGSALDPWVKIEDASGKELARNDDAEGVRDALLEWKASADGKYTIVTGSLTQGGALDWRYRLRTARVAPDFRATVEASSLVLEPNGTNEIKIVTKRLRNFTNELTVAIEKLPEGISASPATIDAKGNGTSLKFITTNAPASHGPIKVIVTDNVTKEQRFARFDLVSRSENNGVPGGYSKLLVESTEDLWLTVKGPKPEKPATPAAP